MFDPRVTPARPDLAAKHLEGKVLAVRFVEGVVREVIEPQVPLVRVPTPDAPLDTEAMFGERVTVYDTNDEGWSWGQLATDGYVGWLPSNALAVPGPEPTHTVAALRTFVFPAASIKRRPLLALSFGARLAVIQEEGAFAVTASGGYVPRVHVAPLGRHESDWVAIAERFLGVPYLWGGKTSLGLDCSGLVQAALTACGIACPRDSDMQERALGCAVDVGPALGSVRRGDLVFWKGHVAIVGGSETIVHANAFHMAVAREPLAEAVARIAASGSAVTSVRRLAPSATTQ